MNAGHANGNTYECDGIDFSQSQYMSCLELVQKYSVNHKVS